MKNNKLFILGVINVLMSAVILLLLNVSVDDETFNLWLNIGQILNVAGVLLVAVWGIEKFSLSL